MYTYATANNHARTLFGMFNFTAKRFFQYNEQHVKQHLVSLPLSDGVLAGKATYIENANNHITYKIYNNLFQIVFV